MAAPHGTTTPQQLRPRSGATAMTRHAVAPRNITGGGAIGSGATGGGATGSGATGSGAMGGSAIGGGTTGGGTTSGGTMGGGARVAAQGRQQHDAQWCSGGTTGSSSNATVAA